MKVEPEAAVGVDVGMDERGDAAPVVGVEPPGPSGIGEHLLDHAEEIESLSVEPALYLGHSG